MGRPGPRAFLTPSSPHQSAPRGVWKGTSRGGSSGGGAGFAESKWFVWRAMHPCGSFAVLHWFFVQKIISASTLRYLDCVPGSHPRGGVQMGCREWAHHRGKAKPSSYPTARSASFSGYYSHSLMGKKFPLSPPPWQKCWPHKPQ